ncbi:MAG: EVE domain-containing protein [Bdellovibrio sp.]
MKYWLMKSEPDVYSLDDLRRDKRTWWEGVRNYQARNFMMKDMQVGDGVLFYHSNAEPPGVAGLARVSQVAAPDKTQFDKKSDYYEPKASTEKPVWFCVEVEYFDSFKEIVSLSDLRAEKKLEGMIVLQKGSRLSVQPVEKKHFDWIQKMGGL